MTRENKIIVGLGDIKAVIFECRHADCQTRVAVKADNVRIPTQCPQCGESWTSEMFELAQVRKMNAAQAFCNALRECRITQEKANGAKFTILLEFDSESRP